MSQELAITAASQNKVSALQIMASRFSVEPAKLLQTLKDTVFKNASDSELMALTIVANEYGLNPLTKEIYAFPAKGGGIVPVVSVDGWIRIINEHPQMDGMEFEWENADNGDPVSCTAIIWRKDRTRPTKVTEYFSECSRATDPWKMKHRMLRHKALIQGGRVAFGFGGIYDEDEAEVIKEAKAFEVKKPIFTTPAPKPALPQHQPEDTIPMAAQPVETTVEPPTRSRGRAAKPVDRPPTLLEKLRMKMALAKISEQDLLAYIAEVEGVTFASLDVVSAPILSGIDANWDGCVEAIYEMNDQVLKKNGGK